MGNGCEGRVMTGRRTRRREAFQTVPAYAAEKSGDGPRNPR